MRDTYLCQWYIRLSAPKNWLMWKPSSLSLKVKPIPSSICHFLLCERLSLLMDGNKETGVIILRPSSKNISIFPLGNLRFFICGFEFARPSILSFLFSVNVDCLYLLSGKKQVNLFVDQIHILNNIFSDLVDFPLVEISLLKNFQGVEPKLSPYLVFTVFAVNMDMPPFVLVFSRPKEKIIRSKNQQLAHLTSLSIPTNLVKLAIISTNTRNNRQKFKRSHKKRATPSSPNDVFAILSKK